VMDNERRCLHRGYIRLISPSKADAKSMFFGKLAAVPEIRSCETAPSARGKGLYRRVLNEQLRFLHSLGHSSGFLDLSPENLASYKGAKAAGFETCRELNDWILFRSLVLQRVRENSVSSWRLFWK
jgi:hypothetical protein